MEQTSRTSGRTIASSGQAGALTAREAAVRLGVSERTIRREIARGRLAARKLRGSYHIAPAALDRYRNRLADQHVPDAVAGAPARPVEITLAPSYWPQAPPAPLTPLVGRQRECAETAALLRASGVRLVTLTGPGGVGKTRLSLAVAGDVADAFGDGTVFVDLAPVADPALVGSTIARALRAPEAGDRPIERVLTARLRHREMLVLLDNCEHLLPSAPLVAQLLMACPGLKVLATSRAPLQVRGETVVAVPPLPTPEPDRAGQEPDVAAVETVDSVRLFVGRVRAARADFALTASTAPAVAEICRRADGLPLAIELAAARCAVLSPPALLDRLDQPLTILAAGPRDAPPRLRSMREAIAWSHDLLSPEEQMVFRRLAVFAGGFTLDAADVVGGRESEVGSGMTSRSSDPPPPTSDPVPDTLDLVASLVAQNLLTRRDGDEGTDRFGMLETVREYALERLRESGEEAAIRRRHAEYLLRLVEHAERQVPRPDRWWVPFETEWANLRAALAWTVESGETRLGMQIGASLFGYWLLRGQVGEGLGWLHRLLAAGAGEPAELRARVELALGCLCQIAGDLERAEGLAREAQALSDAAGDVSGAASSGILRGLRAEAAGDLERAEACYADARDRFLAAGIDFGAANVAPDLGRVVNRLGRREEARNLITWALDTLDIESGGAWTAATAYADLGLLVADEGDLVEAATHVEESLRLRAAIGDQMLVLLSLTAAARVLAEAGEMVAAARVMGAAVGVREQAGPSIWALARPAYERAETLTRAVLDEPAFDSGWNAGRALSTEEAVAAARAALAVVRGPSTASTSPPAERTIRLTDRERAILRLVAAGQTDQEAAAVLGIRARTVTAHITAIRRKLEAPSRTAAVAEAIRRGLA